MGVSATGQGMHMSAVRNGVATAMVILALFFYLYGPPLTDKMRTAANARCNELTGSTFRSYKLAWETTTFSGVDVPHWQCYPVGKAVSESVDLGWWVDF
jgi:hypothetical protein